MKGASVIHPETGSEQVWMRLGFLVAELFMALAVIFLVGSTVGHVTNPGVTPTPTPTITPTPEPTPTVLVNCGLDTKGQEYQYDNLQNATGLRSSPPDSTAVKTLRAKIQHDFASNNRIAGLVEVYGGGSNLGLGLSLASGVTKALKSAGGPFTTNRTLYQQFGNTLLPSNSMILDVFYYTQATVCS